MVGTVGRIDYQKAPEHFIAAMDALRHPEAMAVWIGSGPRLDRCGRGARSPRAVSPTASSSSASDPTSRSLLPAFDVFAMASRYEGLPCAVVEAMRCGVPVVATAVNSVPDLVVPGESGVLVPPGRPELLAEAIDDLLDDPAKAEPAGGSRAGSRRGQHVRRGGAGRGARRGVLRPSAGRSWWRLVSSAAGD